MGKTAIKWAKEEEEVNVSIKNEIRQYTRKVHVERPKEEFVMLGINRNTSEENRTGAFGKVKPVEYKKVPAYKMKPDGSIDAYSDTDYTERPGSPEGVVSLDKYNRRDLDIEKEYLGYAGTPDNEYLDMVGKKGKGATKKAYEMSKGGATGAKVEEYMAGNVKGKKRQAKITEIDV